MNGSQIRNRLHRGERVYGTLVVSSSPHWVPMVEQLGIDFVFIDTEHIALDRTTLAWMCQAYAAKGVPPLVRIPSPDPVEACMVLDGGACGIIAPYVETAAQVSDLVGSVKYKPLKGRRLEQAMDDPASLEPQLRDYLATTNADNVLIVNIESVPAIDHLDAILAVEGLDAVLIGPHDLSVSLGIPEQYDNDRFVEAVDGIVRKARAHGIGAGIHAFSAQHSEHELRWAQRGANLIVHGADIVAAGDTLGAEINHLRQELGDALAPPQKPEINI